VPALESDDGRLFESAALCLQIADLHPRASLIPPVGTQARGLVYQWSIFAVTELEARLVQHWRAGSDATGARVLAAVDVVEDALDDRQYLVEDRFTIADVVLGSVLGIGRRLAVLPHAPSVAAYLARLDERPARQRAYEGYMVELPVSPVGASAPR
jgi:glutathione S-transferase